MSSSGTPRTPGPAVRRWLWLALVAVSAIAVRLFPRAAAVRGALLVEVADEALNDCPSVEHLVVLRRVVREVPWTHGRDKVWEQLVEDEAGLRFWLYRDGLYDREIVQEEGKAVQPHWFMHGLFA